MQETYQGLVEDVRLAIEGVSPTLPSFKTLYEALRLSYEILYRRYFGEDASLLSCLSALFDPRVKLKNGISNADADKERDIVTHTHLKQVFGAVHPDSSTFADALCQLSQFQALPDEGPMTDPLGWWDLHKDEFPLLYPVALDVLSIPGSVNAAERHALIFDEAQTVLRQSTLGWDSEQGRIVEAMALIKHNQSGC
ncbi:hypothetical protein V5O48_005658 [Marasmius crinis-equi]|uniref:HAT C-terminal dimerisation domain-containing protein n=1 Tax=Marasmius crinis-equi TaxID=585013 RepID=A0ABR3FLQ3_9AGAR